MKIEVPASKSKEAIKVGAMDPSAPPPSPVTANDFRARESLFTPKHEICRTPRSQRSPVQEQSSPSFVVKGKNPMIFRSGFFIGLFVGVTAILIPNIVFPNENVFGICLRNEAPNINPDFDNRLFSHQHDYLKQVILSLFISNKLEIS